MFSLIRKYNWIRHISWRYMWSKKLPSILTIISVALGVGLICSVYTLRDETKRRFEEEGQAFDIVMGPKGSPLQLVLSSVYFLDAATGSIPYKEYESIKKNEDVAAAFPIGLGDNYHGFRIVGTTRDIFDHEWQLDSEGKKIKRPFKLAEGRYFKKSMEAVVGGIVAKQTGLKIGDKFAGTHAFGLDAEEHAKHKYTVVGILEIRGTPMDHAIFCSLDSVWEVHGHHHHPPVGSEGDSAAHTEASEQSTTASASSSSDSPACPAAKASTDATGGAGLCPACVDADKDGEHHELTVSAVLINLKSPALRFTFADYVDKNYNAMAVIPVNEIRMLYDQLLSPIKLVLLVVAFLVVVVAAITIMIGLYLSIQQRRRDLAIMRALGASASLIFGTVILEALLITILGIVAGWLLGNAISYGLGLFLAKRIGMTITVLGLSEPEPWAIVLVGVLGYLAGVLPAWQAYRRNVARDLAEL